MPGAGERVERHYADLYELAPIGHCTIDPHGVVGEANLEAARLLGTSRAALTGRLLTSVVSTDEVRLRAHLVACFTRRERVVCELTLRRPEGTRVVVQMVSTPLNAIGEAPLVCMTALTDISALKDSEERLGMLSSVGEVLASSLDYRATLPALVRLTLPLLADVAFVDVVDFAGRVERLGGDGRSGTVDYEGSPQAEVLRSRAPMISGSQMLLPLTASGRTLGVFTFLLDRSKRVYSDVERQLARAVAVRTAVTLENAQLYESARQAIRAREELLTAVSHNLKNPLHSMRLNCEHLLATVPSVEDCQGRKQLEAISRGIDRMMEMIRDLSEQARIESGQLTLDRVWHPLDALVVDTLTLLRPLAARKQVALTATTAMPPLAILCDRARVIQVLSNLVGNAIKFTPPGGAVAIEVDVGERVVRFAVRDDGPGIPHDQLGHVFERYWHSDARHSGSGLGLFIAKAIVEAHGGEIDALSELGHGTTIWFTLPV